MQFAKRLLMGAGAVVLVTALLMVAAPKTVRAVVATLVQVANTTANPVNSVDVDRSTRIPYQSSSAPPYGCLDICLFHGFTGVPTGYRLVVQNVSAFLTVGSGSTPLPFGYINGSGGQNFNFTGVYTGNFFAIVNQQVTSYHDAGDIPYVTISADFTGGTPGTVTLTGYLENCSVTGCPPVQN